MATRKVATVFGGSGFIGRYLVKRLARQGYVVRVAVRDPEAALFLKPMGRVGQVVPLFAPVTNAEAVARAVEDSELVVNLVGLLSEGRAGDFQRVHTEGAGLVARAAASAGVRTLVHISAIGADPHAAARYAATKGAGEEAVRAAFPRAVILRPSVVFGPEDQFFNRFGAMAAWLPVVPVICGDSEFQPVYVGDVADAIIAAVHAPAAAGKTYELGGPAVWRFRALLEWIVQQTGRKRKLLTIPLWLARLQAAIAERLPGKPFTRDQLLMLGQPNICHLGMPGLSDLGIVPTPIQLVVPTYLVRFRQGGKAAGASDRLLSGPITPKRA
jgi:uncharacterized protein YbjT (DUF2867 family)